MANRRAWPIPSDAEVILNMKFHVYAHSPRVYHAEAQIEFPVGKTDFVYASIYKSAKTERCIAWSN